MNYVQSPLAPPPLSLRWHTRRQFAYRISALGALLLIAGALPSASASPRRLRLAFGSCSSQTEPQPLWPLISTRSPDLFLWLGDIVYADTPIVGKWRIPAQLREVARAYAEQERVPGYAAFVSSGVPIVGVWDDHDLGVNDAHAGSVSAAYRNASARHLLDFLREPPLSPRRARDGVYAAYVLDSPPPGSGSRAASLHSAEGPLPAL